jgi:predicted O-linked N-acetylglucosamine transferase (SPINDLY family)
MTELGKIQKAYTDSLNQYERSELTRAIHTLEDALVNIDINDYILLSKQHTIPKGLIVEIYYNLGVFLKELTEISLRARSSIKKILTPIEKTNFDKAISSFRTVILLQPEHENSLSNIVSVLTIICSCHTDDFAFCIKNLQDCLFYQPYNHTIHYNLGLMYQKTNKLENAVIHYKLAIELGKTRCKSSKDLNSHTINCFYGLSCVYTSIKEWPSALHFLTEGLKLSKSDPDLNNQLGVVYTELRRTDLAYAAYTVALSHYKESIISNDLPRLLSNIYVNMGHMCSYNGSPSLSIEMYERALKSNPKSLFAFQNKLLNMNYICDTDLETHLDEHRKINNFLTKVVDLPIRSVPHTGQMNIGFVSGDFCDHPVSYFIMPILQLLDKTKYNVFCYSETIIDKSRVPEGITVRPTKYVSTEDVCSQIQKDNIHILIDLAGHTAHNRLDVLAQKPAPIQMSYIGYPNTTGLDAIDYRITDRHCDDDNEAMSEHLLYMPNSFLCYESKLHPNLSKKQPYLQNGYLTFGCFNRMNKMSPSFIQLCKSLLEQFNSSKIVFKTKALLNQKVRKNFLQKFGDNAHRIVTLDCTNTHEEHLNVYNSIDIAIDTFPYSGTTTSCEALLMGVPVLSLFSPKCHAHNVTSSILCNSGLEFFICRNHEEFSQKIQELLLRDRHYWINLKHTVRQTFLNGKICDKITFVSDFEKVLDNLR